MILTVITTASLMSAAFWGVLLLLDNPPEPHHGPFFWTLRGTVREI